MRKEREEKGRRKGREEDKVGLLVKSGGRKGIAREWKANEGMQVN